MSQPSRGPSPLRVGGLALIGVGAVAGLIGIASLLPGGSESSPAAPTTTASASASAESPTSAAAPTSESAVPVPSFGATPTGGLAAPGSPGTGGAAGGAGGAGGTGGAGGAGGSGGAGGAGGAAGGAGGAGGGTTAAKMPLRVYNNSTITGLAARAASDFRADGWTVGSVSNYTEQANGQGVIPTSTVYFRPGTGEQASADALAKAFSMRSEPRFAGIQDATPGLIVIVTNDYQKR